MSEARSIPASSPSLGSVDNPGGVGTNSTPLSLHLTVYKYPAGSLGMECNLRAGLPEDRNLHSQLRWSPCIHLEQLANINALQPGTRQANPASKHLTLSVLQGLLRHQ